MGNSCMKRNELSLKPPAPIDNNRTTFISDRNPSGQFNTPSLNQVYGETVSYSYQAATQKQHLIAANPPSTTTTSHTIGQGFNVGWRNIAQQTPTPTHGARSTDLSPILAQQSMRGRGKRFSMIEEPSYRNSINTPIPINSDGSLKKHSDPHHSHEKSHEDYPSHSAHVSPHYLIYQNPSETPMFLQSYVDNY